MQGVRVLWSRVQHAKALALVPVSQLLPISRPVSRQLAYSCKHTTLRSLGQQTSSLTAHSLKEALERRQDLQPEPNSR